MMVLDYTQTINVHLQHGRREPDKLVKESSGRQLRCMVTRCNKRRFSIGKCGSTWFSSDWFYSGVGNLPLQLFLLCGGHHQCKKGSNVI